MELTLYYNDNFQQVTVEDWYELSSMIELYFDIHIAEQVIKVNDKIIDENYDLKDNDLLYISKREMVKNSLCYIVGECNNYAFKMMVDSGAQMNMMSLSLVKLLNLSIDKEMEGNAMGIGGETKMHGVVHCTIKIDNEFYDIKFHVTDQKHDKYMVLIGLDFLYKYQCDISLRNRCLLIQDIKVSFMNDYKIKQYKTPIRTYTPLQKQFMEYNDNVILKKIINNIINHPNEDKYKSIDKNSKTFKENLSSCISFMKDLGFVECDNRLKYTNDVNSLVSLVESV